MFKNIKIGDREIPMKAVASTNIYYKRIFGEDPIVKQTAQMSTADGINFTIRLAYVMAMQAEAGEDREKLARLNEDTLIEWLDEIDYTDLQNALPEVMNLYIGQNKTTSTEKKEVAR